MDTKTPADHNAHSTEMSADAPPTRAAKPISMHDDVPLWHDCCCCEAEPRWVDVAPELGIDLDAEWDAAVERLDAER